MYCSLKTQLKQSNRLFIHLIVKCAN